MAAKGRRLRLRARWARRRAVDQPTDFFARVKDELAPLGIEPSWSFKYSGGANPIAFTLAYSLASHSKVLDILAEAYSLA